VEGAWPEGDAYFRTEERPGFRRAMTRALLLFFCSMGDEQRVPEGKCEHEAQY